MDHWSGVCNQFFGGAKAHKLICVGSYCGQQGRNTGHLPDCSPGSSGCPSNRSASKMCTPRTFSQTNRKQCEQ